MGPTKAPSYSGHNYATVLVDNYFKYAWVYFLKEKNEALGEIVEFNNTIKGEFEEKINCLRSDNGGEFMLEECFKYCIRGK